jgi:hypothetical protein
LLRSQNTNAAASSLYIYYPGNKYKDDQHKLQCIRTCWGWGYCFGPHIAVKFYKNKGVKKGVVRVEYLTEKPLITVFISNLLKENS